MLASFDLSGQASAAQGCRACPNATVCNDAPFLPLRRSHTPHKIPRFPYLSTPQAPSYPWELFEYLPCADALEYSDCLCHSQFGRYLYQHMHMIFRNFHRFNPAVVFLRNAFKKFPRVLLETFIHEKIFAIFRAPDYMILALPYRVGSFIHPPILP